MSDTNYTTSQDPNVPPALDPRLTELYLFSSPPITVHEMDNMLRRRSFRYPTFAAVPEFLEVLFPQDDRVTDLIIRAAIEKGLYQPGVNGTGTGRWTAFPADRTSVDTTCDAFVLLANALSVKIFEENRLKPRLIWEIVHTPHASASTVEADYTPRVTASTTGGPADLSALGWWHNVVVPVEVVEQHRVERAVINFVRRTAQIFRGQPNRRFLYGLVLAGQFMQVWMVDRSGSMMSEYINIHESPKDVIRVISGFCLKCDHELGWDLTLRHSTLRPLNPSRPLWECSMFTNDGQEEVFVLYHEIYLCHDEVLHGRATRVWKAWKKIDIRKPIQERKIYVIKDAWVREDIRLEGDTFNLVGPSDGLARLVSYRVIQQVPGQDDETDQMSQGLKLEGVKIDMQQIFQQAESASDGSFPMGTDPLGDTGWLLDIDKYYVDHGRKRPLNFRHTRALLADFGWSLRRFTSLKELLGGLHDAIRGHIHITDHGIMHGDISESNILLTGGPKPNRGLLIDLEMAFEYDKAEPSLDLPRGHRAFMGKEVLTSIPVFDPLLVQRKSRNDHEVVPAEPSSGNYNYLDDEELDDESSDNFYREVEDMSLRRHPFHEIEGFFWVLCWISLTREAPGVYRPPREPVDLIFHSDLDTMGKIKGHIINDASSMEEYVLGNLAPYFSPLKSTLEDLRRILCEGYWNRANLGYEHPSAVQGLTERFLDILEASEASVDLLQPPGDNREVQRRIYDRWYDPIDYAASGINVLKG
ncbi:hypothetical protein NEOLEDRAFT_1178145 [Neolentinus lepideus HHB14362 ss-1]|uniref:Fungal-type protein kinase domain-containing protein n=1 Tax=Neolentinus lepideus HHB14362 ss-1 TaxID=1314782 RepID=A0A165SU21_9AGAM|nr:hypothetical protein NEOLEDRAFT_1178145 [Neolentinus lepideus HHB14362 ss-1]